MSEHEHEWKAFVMWDTASQGNRVDVQKDIVPLVQYRRCKCGKEEACGNG